MINSALIHLLEITILNLFFSMNLSFPLKGLDRCLFPILRSRNLEMELTPPAFTFLCRNNLRMRRLYVNSDTESMPPALIYTFLRLKWYSARFNFELVHVVMPRFGPEPKFEPEPGRTGPRSSSKVQGYG